MEDNNHIIFYIAVVLAVSLLFYIVGFQPESAESFVIRCNEIHGVSNWQVDRLSQWTTYSDEFWRIYPRVYIGNPLDGETYSCFNKR